MAGPTKLRRVARSGLRVGVTAAVFALSGLAVVSGAALVADGAARDEVIPPTPATVHAMPLRLEPGYRVTRRLVGQVEAPAQADLGFELGGRITEVLVEEGDTVPAGTVLARLDTATLIPQRAALEAELAALAADAELARLTLGRNDALTERGFRSVAAQDEARLGLARAEAGMDALRARIAGIDVQLEKSVLTAPFDAVVGARLADPGQTAAAGQPVLVLFGQGALHLRVSVPEDLAKGLRPGDPAFVEAGGTGVQATVLRLRPDLDPTTRSRTVIVALPAGAIAPLGTTAELILHQDIPQEGFWVPTSALREGQRGSWSVMALEPATTGEVVRTAAVEVIHAEEDRVFLRGLLPDGARIVAEAPDRVAPGQSVVAVLTAALEG